MRGRRLAGIIVAAIGVIAFVGSFVWRAVAVPALVRYPTDLDVRPEYEGSVTLFVDPTTYAPLTTPRQTPLTVKRHLQALGDQSSKERVVVKETLELASPGLFDTTVQENQYVMDRRSMANLADPRAWAFTPDHIVDRSGTFRLQFPFDTKSTTYLGYKNEIEMSYEIMPAEPPEGEAGGFNTRNFHATKTATPVTPQYLAALGKIVPLPTELGLDKLQPILANAGFDISVELPQLLPNLSPEDTQTILGLAAKPIQLQYEMAFEGSDSVEPYTGSIVDVTEVKETVSAKPTGDSVTTLTTLLQKYPNAPAAQRGLAAIAKLNTEPLQVFVNDYHQTDASVTDIAKEIRDQRDKRRLAEKTLPNSLLIGGIVLAVIGAALALWPRRTKPRAEAPPVAPDTPEEEGAPVPPVGPTDT
jgi:Porin PorA